MYKITLCGGERAREDLKCAKKKGSPFIGFCLKSTGSKALIDIFIR
jgi:hypothetical protein